MDAATALAPERLDEIIETSQGQDPMVVRWAINTTVRDKFFYGTQYHNTSDSPYIPYGKFFPLVRFNTPEENHSIDEEQPKERMVTRTAQSAQIYLETMLAGKDEFGNLDARKPNHGLQIGFYGEKDTGKMAVISSTLLPSLSRIREICANQGWQCPISVKCEGQDDVGVIRETCATCWFQWIQSDACEAYIDIVATNGMTVLENGTDERLVTPSHMELMRSREIVELSLQTGIAALQNEWGKMLGEMERKERRGFDDAGYQHGIRKDIHAVKPQDRELAMVREYGAMANKGDGGTGVVLERVVGVLDRIDQRLTRLEVPQTVWAGPTCGKPTVNGGPCERILKLGETACFQHNS